MAETIPAQRRASRDFRVKFPDDVLQESLAGQLWFGAEVREGWFSGTEGREGETSEGGLSLLLV